MYGVYNFETQQDLTTMRGGGLHGRLFYKWALKVYASHYYRKEKERRSHDKDDFRQAMAVGDTHTTSD